MLCVALQVDDKGKVYIGFMLHIQEATNYDSEEEQEPLGPLKSDKPTAKPAQPDDPLPSEVLQLVLDKIEQLERGQSRMESLMTVNSSGAGGSSRQTVIDATSEGFTFEQAVEQIGNSLCPHGHVQQFSIKKGPPLCHLSHCPASAAEVSKNPGKLFTVNHCWETRKKYPVYTAQKKRKDQQKVLFNEAKKAHIKNLKEQHTDWDYASFKIAASYESLPEDIQK